jgi:hypothetical protein
MPQTFTLAHAESPLFLNCFLNIWRVCYISGKRKHERQDGDNSCKMLKLQKEIQDQ